MSTFLVFVVAGLGAGAVYALAGVGLVLTYRTSGVFNFAYGALAGIAAYLFYTLFVTHGWPWEAAAAVSTLGVGFVMGLLLHPLARRLRDAPLTLQVAGTVGLLLAIEAALQLIYGTEVPRNVPQFLSKSTATFLGGTVPVSDLITLAVAVVATLVLTWWLRSTSSGRATRAVVDDAALLDLSGINPNSVRRIAWIVGVSLAAGSGVLFAPLLPLDPGQLTLLVVAAFGAVAVGRFVSLPWTCAGGLLIGILASLASRYLATPALAGLSSAVPFLVLFVVVCVLPRGRSLVRPVIERRIGSDQAMPLPVHAAAGIVAVAALATVPTFAGAHLIGWTLGLTDVIVFLSLALLVRTSGQISLSQVTFVAIGAAALSHFSAGLGLPWLAALLLAGVIAMPVGAILAIPAVRQSGLFLALATFGFGILVEYVFYPQSYMFGLTGAGITVPRPGLFGSDKGYYYLVLVFVVLASAAVMWLSRSRLGRLLRGIGDAPLALETTGTSVTVTRVLVFCLAAFLAAVAGGLNGAAQGTISGLNYSPLLSLTYFAVIIVVVGREPWNALLAALPLDVIPSYLTSSQTATVLQLIFGISALLISALPPPRTRIRIPLLGRRAHAASKVPAQAGRVEPPHGLRPAKTRPGELRVKDVTVTFGGVTALKDVSISAPIGKVTGLIGPNGAGKTTMLTVCSGLIRSRAGKVLFRGVDMTSAVPSARARGGLGRTFQHMQLFSSMTVRQNVALGREGRYANLNPLAHLVTRRAAREEIATATEDALETCGLTGLADSPVGALSTGQQRLVDLARCLAGGYDLLLLDEPSSGLDAAETAELGEVVRRVVAGRGVGVLLVEHDLSLVVGLSDHIYVLDFGRLVAEGPPAEVVSSEIVRAVYLGDADVVPPLDAAPPNEADPMRAVIPRRGSDRAEAAADAPLLAIDGVTAGYGHSTVLREVSVAVPAGSVVALLGANGAGKTTLLRVAAGLLKPSSGAVSMQGVDVTGQPPFERSRRGLSLVPEGRGIFRALSVRDNLLTGYGRQSDAMEHALELFPELRAHVSQAAGTLSGGEQQMLALARSYLANPRVMLVDELSIGLAPVVIDKVYSRLHELASRGMAALLVEQYVHRALAFAQHVYVLVHGQIAVAGSVAELRDHDMMSRYLGAGSRRCHDETDATPPAPHAE